MGKVVVCDHPLIQHKLAYIRDEKVKERELIVIDPTRATACSARNNYDGVGPWPELKS